MILIGTLNPEEDGRQAEHYLRAHGRLASPASSTVTYVPRAHSRTVDEEMKRDELARRFMYTSTQQAAFDEVNWGIFFTRETSFSHETDSFFVIQIRNYQGNCPVH